MFVVVRPPPRFPGHHPHFSQHHHHSASGGQTSNSLNSSIVPVQPGKYFIIDCLRFLLFVFLKGEIGFDGKMLRKAMARKTVDYNPSVIRYLEVRNIFSTMFCLDRIFSF